MIRQILLYLLPCLAFADLSLEEKVGQLLMVHFNGETVNQDAKTLVQELHVGGIIYYNWANGLRSFEQVQQLSKDLQNLSSIPLLIAADQEGGLVERLNQGFTRFPGNKALGMTSDPNLAEESAKAIGEEMLAAGVNMNLAPVVDINSNPKNPIIGIRAFSDSPERVVSFGQSALSGYRKSGVISCLKHFPGHGDIEVDSHLDLPVLHKSLSELQSCELIPFAKLAKKADAVMTAHILIPSIDPTSCATLSKNILDLLRNDIGFQGIIICDSLVMQGVLNNSGASIEETVLRAFEAGCDLLLLGGKQLQGASNLELTVSDVQKIHKAFVSAVKEGRISEKRLNESLDRVLSLKKKISKAAPSLDLAAHQKLSEQIAKQALQVLSKRPIPSLADSKVALFAPELAKAPCLSALSSNALFFQTITPTQEEIQAARRLAEDSDVLIIFSYSAWKNSAQTTLINHLLQTNKPLILVALRDPLDAAYFPEASLILSTFSPSIPAIQAATEYLKR